ncbi:hypothetical protein BHE74_00039122 [Ensete ventricosum]|uniref:Uncharacterized protein n=2 Tax=Ensete ventricosum TaxID=4639 RepID=A0A444FX05_ENSVE|nr:hypothetical protein B296_00055109 [Ensete ventricosum]RWW27157.1 hypothetical protein GW17_00008429 [Ensete ventricosum]RWW54308.1 hypothetical protein BHE74_00039122 [Ensete ventricosum]RZS26062.1 hypothetical protein BHM03_00059354 [Ensete ventricosum]
MVDYENEDYVYKCGLGVGGCWWHAHAMVEISSDGTQSDTSPAVAIPPAVGGDPVPSSTPGSHAPGEPPSQEERQPIGRPWTTALFDCGENQTYAVLTAFCPCVTFGQIAEILDEGQTSCTLGSFMYILLVPALCTCWILGAHYRQQLRKKYNLISSPAQDRTLHLFCPCCSLCQEFRELHNRGLDPSQGWMGYLAKQQETRTLPPDEQSMDK